MKKLILGSTALVGVASLANAAQASDGIKLDVGGFFQTVYQGVFDDKGTNDFGDHRNTDRFVHNAEVWFKGETTLDNGLTVGAQVELEGENATDQIDKSFVYWSGGFGKVSIGSQDSVIGACTVFPPGATANFSAFSPASWGSNDPIGSNSVCTDAVGPGNSQSFKYTTPNFARLPIGPCLHAEQQCRGLHRGRRQRARAHPPRRTAPRTISSAPMPPIPMPATAGASTGAAAAIGRRSSTARPGSATAPAPTIRPL